MKPPPSHAAGFASRPCMYYVASSLASRDGTQAHCSMNIKCSVYSMAATITPDAWALCAAFMRRRLLLEVRRLFEEIRYMYLQSNFICIFIELKVYNILRQNVIFV